MLRGKDGYGGFVVGFSAPEVPKISFSSLLGPPVEMDAESGHGLSGGGASGVMGFTVMHTKVLSIFPPPVCRNCIYFQSAGAHMLMEEYNYRWNRCKKFHDFADYCRKDEKRCGIMGHSFVHKNNNIKKPVSWEDVYLTYADLLMQLRDHRDWRRNGNFTAVSFGNGDGDEDGDGDGTWNKDKKELIYVENFVEQEEWNRD